MNREDRLMREEQERREEHEATCENEECCPPDEDTGGPTALNPLSASEEREMWGPEDETPIEGKYRVCPVCNGEGTYVNPAVDGNGLTQEDFDEDPDLRENYFSGMYDVQCKCCHGRRVVTKQEYTEYQERLDDHHLMMRESGIYGGYDSRI